MIVTKLNEELKIQDGDNCLILLIDHKHGRFDFFKSYEQKTFEAHEIVKLNGLISEAIRIANESLHKEPEIIKEDARPDPIQLPSSRKWPKEQCPQCGMTYEKRSYNYKEKICPKCKELNSKS